MPAYKTIDKATGKLKSWYVKFNYRDYTGQIKTKLKRGFSTRKQALEYERDFLDKHQYSPTILFKNFYEQYIQDKEKRNKVTSLLTIKKQLSVHVLPVFANVPLNEITANMVREWQSNILDNGLAPTTVYNINAQFSTMLNYAVKYYKLPSNPVRLAGGIGTREHRSEYWTREQFDTFILSFDKPSQICFFSLLFWSGARIGEVLALTGADFRDGAIYINKTFTRLKGQNVIQSPKTKSSIRRVPLPAFMVQMLNEWINKTSCKAPDRLFEWCFVESIGACFRQHRDALNLPKIPIHGLRHSHASYLINKGVDMYDLMKRLGHERISTTIDTYSHLYEEKQDSIAEKLGE